MLNKSKNSIQNRNTHYSFLFSVILMLWSMNVNGQFTASSIPGVAFGAASVNPRNTGCDIREISGNVYRVSVWEPNGTGTGGFGWSVNTGGTYSGFIDLQNTSDVWHPDVCIVYDGTTVFAVVAYFYNSSSGFGRWIWEAYRWSSFTNSFVINVTPQVITTGFFGSTVNIDGNNSTQGEFVIVYDRIISSSDVVYAFPGQIVSGSLTTYNPVKIANGKSPDVSLFKDASDNIAHVAYLDAVNSYNLTVDYHYVANLISSTNSPTNELVQSPQNASFNRPRIASPNASGGSASEFTVVVEDKDFSISVYSIVGYNSDNTGFITSTIYNNGSNNSPDDLTPHNNYYISVTYDSNYPTDGIWVGWTFDNPPPPSNAGGASAYAVFPIVLKCDNAGEIIANYDYWEVPDGLANTDLCDLLSMAGRYANDELYLTYAAYDLGGSPVNDVYLKEVSSVGTATSFRQVSNYTNTLPATNNIISLLTGYDNNETATVMVYDALGRQVFMQTGKLNELKRSLKALNKNNIPSVYFVTALLHNNSQVVSGKLIVTE